MTPHRTLFTLPFLIFGCSVAASEPPPPNPLPPASVAAPLDPDEGTASDDAGAPPGSPQAPKSMEITHTLRVMALGDSITEGAMVPGAYRVDLVRMASAEGLHLDMVGARSNGPPSFLERRHEGHPGWRISSLEPYVAKWLRGMRPELVILMIGTNDMLANENHAGAPARLAKLLDRIVGAAPDAEILVATIPPLTHGYRHRNPLVVAYNQAMEELVRARADMGQHLRLVDLHSAMDEHDLLDGIHPSAKGYAKIARLLYHSMRGRDAADSVDSGDGAMPTGPGKEAGERVE